jgi:hypothetical protein
MKHASQERVVAGTEWSVEHELNKKRPVPDEWNGPFAKVKC